jgi:DNA-binding transcriptional LysR family regulator
MAGGQGRGLVQKEQLGPIAARHDSTADVAPSENAYQPRPNGPATFQQRPGLRIVDDAPISDEEPSLGRGDDVAHGRDSILERHALRPPHDRGRALLKGVEAEVTLVVDVMLPSKRLVDAVQAFEATFPTVKMRLHVEALSAVAQLVRQSGAMIGVGGGLLDVEPDLELIHIGDVEMIPVAAPNHPLALSRPNVPGAARHHRQLVLTVRTPFSEGPDVGIFSAETWRLADLGAKHDLLLAGVGWGNMPEPNVRADLAAGRLVRLELPEAKSGRYSFQAMYRTDQPPGPAAAWLIQRFVDQVR